MAKETRFQHYVPRVYFKNFFSPATDLKVAEPYALLDQRADVPGNICAENHGYTLKGDTPEERQLIEDAYRVQYEDHYTRVYQMLVDPNVHEIDDTSRRLIIGVVTSMLFRTPRMKMALSSLSLQVFEAIVAYHKAQPDRIIHDPDGAVVEVGNKDAKTLAKEYEARHKDATVISNFVFGKLLQGVRPNDQLSVVRIDSPLSYITSDNPVLIAQEPGQLIAPMNPDLELSIPLDQKHRLNIYPARLGRPPHLLPRVYHAGDHAVLDVLSSNREQRQLAMRFVYGSEDGLARYAALLDDEPELARLKDVEAAEVERLVREYPELSMLSGYRPPSAGEH